MAVNSTLFEIVVICFIGSINLDVFLASMLQWLISGSSACNVSYKLWKVIYAFSTHAVCWYHLRYMISILRLMMIIVTLFVDWMVCCFLSRWFTQGWKEFIFQSATTWCISSISPGNTCISVSSLRWDCYSMFHWSSNSVHHFLDQNSINSSKVCII